MPKKVKSKYTVRKDGRIVRTAYIDGKKHFFYGSSDEEVDSKYEEFIHPKKPKILLENVIDAWWEKKEPKISVNSVRNYACAKNRIKDAFGDRVCSDISTRDIVNWLEKFALQDMSQKVISNTKCVFKEILDEAFLMGEIETNPAANIPMVKGKSKVQRQPASDSDIQKIEAVKNSSNIARMYYFILYTGARRGEAMALLFRDIDRKTSTAPITKSVAYDGVRPIIKEPKTESGKRTIFIPKNVMEVIPDGNPDDYIFFPDGLPNKTAADKMIRKFMSDNGISSTPHQLRHSYATMLHSAGIDVKDAQHLLGHASITMTQDIYTHLDAEHKKKVGSDINKYIQKKVVKMVVK